MIDQFAQTAAKAVRRVDEIETQIRETEAELQQLTASRATIADRLASEQASAPAGDDDHDRIAAELIADPSKLTDLALRERAREAAEREAVARSEWADGIASLERAVEIADKRIENAQLTISDLQSELRRAMDERRIALRRLLLCRYDVVAREGARLLGMLEIAGCLSDIRDEQLIGAEFSLDEEGGRYRDARVTLWPRSPYADRDDFAEAFAELLNEFRPAGTRDRRAAA